MQFQLRNISPHQPEFASVCKLYTASFPADERRPVEQLRDIALSQSLFRIAGIFVRQSPSQLVMQFAGFVSYWRFGEFVYAEHLATEPHLRGNGIGRLLVEHLKSCASGMPVILEVEPPVDTLTSRRVAFYQRLGFVLHTGFPYMQPAYSPATMPIPLRLMSYSPGNLAVNKGLLRRFAGTIAQEVYLNYY